MAQDPFAQYATQGGDPFAAYATAAPKGDTYTGPDTYDEGYSESWKKTIKDTGAGILRGIGASLDPRNYLANIGKSMEATKDPTSYDPPMSVKNLPSLKDISDPSIGGEMIGGLATGLLLPKAVGGVKAGLQRGAIRTMQSALKPTGTLEKARAGAGYGSKQAISQAVLDEGRIVSPGSLAKAQDALEATDSAAKTALQNGAGQGVLVDPYKVTSAIDAQQGGTFGKQINAQPDTSAIQQVRDNFASNPHVAAPGPVGGMQPLPADLAHEFASNTGRNLKGKFGRLGGATVEAEKAGREAITSQLRDQIPELKDLWDTEARQITTRDALEQAVARRANTDPLGLSTIVGAVKNPALALTAMADRSALLKSMLAQAMSKSRGLVPNAQALRAALLARMASQQPEDAQRR